MKNPPSDPRFPADLDQSLVNMIDTLTKLCFRRRRLAARDDDPLLRDLEHLQAAAAHIQRRAATLLD